MTQVLLPSPQCHQDQSITCGLLKPAALLQHYSCQGMIPNQHLLSAPNEHKHRILTHLNAAQAR
jgi:hypothetical protein